MFSLLDQLLIFLVMDALGECPDTSRFSSLRERVLQLVKELVELRLSNLHICVTSRPEVDIRHTDYVRSIVVPMGPFSVASPTSTYSIKY